MLKGAAYGSPVTKCPRGVKGLRPGSRVHLWDAGVMGQLGPAHHANSGQEGFGFHGADEQGQGHARRGLRVPSALSRLLEEGKEEPSKFSYSEKKLKRLCWE